MEIKKKVWPEYFKLIKSGKKRFELRLANFKVQQGDILILEEWSPKTKKYTGQKLKKKVDYVLKTKDLKFWTSNEIKRYGYQVLQLKD